MRMGIALGGRAMGGPARVADPGAAGERRPVQRRRQVGQLALGAAAVDVAVHQGGDAGAVIAAIFQALQRLQQHGGRRSGPDHAHDAAHQFSFLALFAGLSGAECGRSPGLVHLHAAGDRQRVRGHVAHDHAAGGGHRPRPHGHRRHQGGVRADEGALADHRAMLGDAVVIAGDRCRRRYSRRRRSRRRPDRSGGWPWRPGRAGRPSARRNCRHGRPRPPPSPAAAARTVRRSRRPRPCSPRDG